MSRLIKTDTVGKDRTRLSKGIVIAIRELAKQNDVTTESKDLAAFIALALQTIADGIDGIRGGVGEARLLGQGRPLPHGVALGRANRCKNENRTPGR